MELQAVLRGQRRSQSEPLKTLARRVVMGMRLLAISPLGRVQGLPGQTVWERRELQARQ